LKIEVRSDEIPHPPERVYQTLVDPEVLARVVPGVQRFDAVAPGTYEVEIKMGVGAIRGAYTGRIELTEQNPPKSYRLKGDAKGGTGWARGDALLTLEAVPAGTQIVATANAQVGGKIAGVGQRMIEGIAKTMVRELLDSIGRELAQRPRPSGGQLGFGFRLLGRMIRGFFGRLFGRESA
jgi:carbon monoxide dehydrogenase subunit G